VCAVRQTAIPAALRPDGSRLSGKVPEVAWLVLPCMAVNRCGAAKFFVNLYRTTNEPGGARRPRYCRSICVPRHGPIRTACGAGIALVKLPWFGGEKNGNSLDSGIHTHTHPMHCA
jgi:hypothetical protein